MQQNGNGQHLIDGEKNKSETGDYMSIDNTLLVTRAGEGDSDAFAALYTQYAADMYRFAAYMLNSAADAEDAVQNAVLSAYGNMPALKKPEAFKSWLFKILSNECKKILRMNSRSPDFLPDEDFFFSLKDENAHDAQLGLELQEAVSQLPAPDGQIVLMCVIGGFKSEELAAIFDMPASTVRSKLNRSLDKLRRITAN